MNLPLFSLRHGQDSECGAVVGVRRAGLGFAVEEARVQVLQVRRKNSIMQDLEKKSSSSFEIVLVDLVFFFPSCWLPGSSGFGDSRRRESRHSQLIFHGGSEK